MLRSEIALPVLIAKLIKLKEPHPSNLFSIGYYDVGVALQAHKLGPCNHHDVNVHCIMLCFHFLLLINLFLSCQSSFLLTCKSQTFRLLIVSILYIWSERIPRQDLGLHLYMSVQVCNGIYVSSVDKVFLVIVLLPIAFSYTCVHLYLIRINNLFDFKDG